MSFIEFLIAAFIPILGIITTIKLAVDKREQDFPKVKVEYNLRTGYWDILYQETEEKEWKYYDYWFSEESAWRHAKTFREKIRKRKK